jgi:hypothetical protein
MSLEEDLPPDQADLARLERQRRIYEFMSLVDAFSERTGSKPMTAGAFARLLDPNGIYHESQHALAREFLEQLADDGYLIRGPDLNLGPGIDGNDQITTSYYRVKEFEARGDDLQSPAA